MARDQLNIRLSPELLGRVKAAAKEADVPATLEAVLDLQMPTPDPRPRPAAPVPLPGDGEAFCTP